MILISAGISLIGKRTEDQYFVTEAGANAGITRENTSETEPLVIVRYFGPDVNPDATLSFPPLRERA